MSESRKFVRPCAEFPNDNPVLHDGVSWVCLRVGAPLRPIARMRREPTSFGVMPEMDAPPRIDVPPAAIERVAAIIEPHADVLPLPEYAPEPVFVTESISVAELIVEPVVAPPMYAAADLAAAALPDVDPRFEGYVDLSQDTPRPAVAVVALGEPEIELTAFIAAGREATAPPPSEYALSVRVAEPVEVETRPELEALSLDLTPSSEIRASDASDELELDDLDQGGDDGFNFDGGADVDFTDSVEVAAAEQDRPSRLEVESGPGLAKTAAPSAPPPPAAPAARDAFGSFVDAVVEVARASGAENAALVLPALLNGACVPSDGLAEALRRAPASSATVIDQLNGHIQLSGGVLATGKAWRAVLLGETGDMEACGTSTLDGWAGDVLRALGVGADGAVDIRRELRRRGVAAFGMLLAA